MADRCRNCERGCWYSLARFNGLCFNCRCKHCKLNPRESFSVLCWACYDDPVIREQYPVNSVRADVINGVGHSGRNGLPPPTTALPGTKRKQQVLAWRAKKKYLLHSPLDPNFFDRPEEDLL